MSEVPALTAVVKLIAAGVVGGIIAFLFERFKWFQSLTSDQRWWLILGLSVGLPLLAQFALQFVPAETWAMLEPYWHSMALGFTGWLASQVVHKTYLRRQALNGSA